MSAYNAATAYAALRDLGFVADLGVAWTRELPDGTTIVVSGVDHHGEPDDVRSDGPACAQRLRDPDDWATRLAVVDCETFAGAIATVRRWIVGDFAPLAYTIIVGSHCLGTVEACHVTAAELHAATVEVARRQWGRPLVLAVYDDAEASPDDEARETFAAALDVARSTVGGAA